MSTEGGYHPLWTKGGRELVFQTPTAMWAVSFDPESGALGSPVTLFRGRYVWGLAGEIAYDVTPDGERFALIEPPEGRTPRRVVVITDFLRTLRERAGEGAS